FQAEDGIRDFHVTGVQTCALPILQFLRGGEIALVVALSKVTEVWLALDTDAGDRADWTADALTRLATNARLEELPASMSTSTTEIGRASCRDRVKLPVGRGARRKT